MKGLPEDILAGVERLSPCSARRPRSTPAGRGAPARGAGGAADGEAAPGWRRRAPSPGAWATWCGPSRRTSRRTSSGTSTTWPDRMWNAGGAGRRSGFAHRVVAVCRGFGNKSELRFRYAHDFLYGYDWARWVVRQPERRAAIGPFDLAFFDYLEGRLRTLVELIAEQRHQIREAPGPGVPQSLHLLPGASRGGAPAPGAGPGGLHPREGLALRWGLPLGPSLHRPADRGRPAPRAGAGGHLVKQGRGENAQGSVSRLANSRSTSASVL